MSVYLLVKLQLHSLVLMFSLVYTFNTVSRGSQQISNGVAQRVVMVCVQHTTV